MRSWAEDAPGRRDLGVEYPSQVMPWRRLASGCRERGRSWRSTLWPTRRTGELTARLPIDYLAFSLYKTFGPHQGVLWGAAFPP